MDQFLWCEKYRPRKVADTILPKQMKTTFQKIVDSGEIPNMLFSGTAGLGKTTVAKAICDELDLDYILINGSEEGNIDTLRGKIKQFASTVSLSGGYKVVILDESDYLNPQSTQPALRAFMDEFSNNCRFILTCNYRNRILEPLQSRCAVYEFNTSRKDLAQLCGQFLARSKTILEAEGVSYDEKVIADLILKHAPDWRRTLNEMQRLTIAGNLADSSGEMNTSIDIQSLTLSLKGKDFKKMRAWVVNHMDMDTSAIIRSLYDNMMDFVSPGSIPQLVLILGDYQYKAAFVADRELNTVAMMTEIMASVQFK